MFENRKLVIATMHGKEQVIAPLVEKALKVKCFVPKHFNTDLLGTFTGEIERIESPLDTVRKKCLQAMEITNCDLGIANEGSFGPHPMMPFVTADEELIILIDKKNNIEIVAKEISTVTNFNGKYVKSITELLDFATQINFPQHGIILKADADTNENIVKGITDQVLLVESFENIMHKYARVYVATEMRAMYNPMRMKVIELCTQKLIEQVQSKCPNCSMPGYIVTQVNKGLPCSLCGLPTNSTYSYLYTCKSCAYQNEIKFPHGKQQEDPAFCDFCNP